MTTQFFNNNEAQQIAEAERLTALKRKTNSKSKLDLSSSLDLLVPAAKLHRSIVYEMLLENNQVRIYIIFRSNGLNYV